MSWINGPQKEEGCFISKLVNSESSSVIKHDPHDQFTLILSKWIRETNLHWPNDLKTLIIKYYSLSHQFIGKWTNDILITRNDSAVFDDSSFEIEFDYKQDATSIIQLRFTQPKYMSETWYDCRYLDSNCLCVVHAWGRSYFTLTGHGDSKEKQNVQFLTEVNTNDGNITKWYPKKIESKKSQRDTVGR